MPLKILKPASPPHLNSFVIISEWMQGDADGNLPLSKSYPRSKEKLAEEYARFLMSLKDLDRDDFTPNKMAELLQEYPLLQKDVAKAGRVSSDEMDDEDVMGDACYDYFEIPSDATGDHQDFCSFDSLKIVFFNAKGIEHKVALRR
jgi:hypothetical protein